MMKREQIIEEAFEFAKENTLESFVDTIVSAVRENKMTINDNFRTRN